MSYLKLGHTTNTSSWTNIHYNSIACRFCTSQRERACLDLFGHMRAFNSLSRALRLSAVSHVWGRTGCEFLSDAPFFGLSLCTEFQLANCACASGWSCLMNFDLKFHLGLLAVSELLALKKKCMYTLKWRCILCTRGSLKSCYTPCNTYFLCFYFASFVAILVTSLRVFE